MRVPIFVAELSINHLGMVGIAKEMIVEAKKAGANYVKIKKKKVNGYYDSHQEDWRNFPFSKYRQSLELTEGELVILAEFCEDIGIGWFSTVHDVYSLEEVSKLDPSMYKVASMDVDNKELMSAVINKCADEKKPLVVSVGGKSHKDTKRLVEYLTAAGIEIFVLHTVSIYPTPIGKNNIPYIINLKSELCDANEKVRIGYSGHEEGFSASVAASTLNIDMIERHFTLSREYKIHHIRAALLPEEFKDMVSTINSIASEFNGAVVDVVEGEDVYLEHRRYV